MRPQHMLAVGFEESLNLSRVPLTADGTTSLDRKNS